MSTHPSTHSLPFSCSRTLALPFKKTTITHLRSLRGSNTPITALSAYDYPTALACSAHSVDITIVGDSLAQVCLGYPSTVLLTLDEMLHHCRAVARGTTSPLLVADMPFGTYFSGTNDAIRAAVRLIQEGNAEAVKIEGGEEVAELVKALTRMGIPVMAHIGLLPQRHVSFSGYRIQGRTAKSATTLLRSARVLEDAGAFSIVLEAVPSTLAAYITEQLNVPTIGVGAGPGTSGQALVWDDMIGRYAGNKPKFVRHFADLHKEIEQGISKYTNAVRDGTFPDPVQESYTIDHTEWEKFLAAEGRPDWTWIPRSEGEKPRISQLGDTLLSEEFAFPLNPDFYKPLPHELAFLKATTGIENEEELRAHVLVVQKKAYKVVPYPCIYTFGFIRISIADQPVYQDILKIGREREHAILLDIGCGLGADTRKLVMDGFPAHKIVQSDLIEEWKDLSNELFRTTEETFPAKFIQGGVFDPDFLSVTPPAQEPVSNGTPDLSTLKSLNALRGRCSVINAGAIIHLFSEEQQVHLARALAGLLSPEPGSIICGINTAAESDKGPIPLDIYDRTYHLFSYSEDSWKELWCEKVFSKGEVEVWTKYGEVLVMGNPMPSLLWYIRRL